MSAPAPLFLLLVVSSVVIERSMSDGNPVSCTVPGKLYAMAPAYILILDVQSRLEDHYEWFHTSILRHQSLRNPSRKIIRVGAEIDTL